MIIGITGTDGAGKGAVVDYLVKEKGFIHYSARDLITQELEKRGLDSTRENMRIAGNDMRKQDRAFIVNTYIQKAQKEKVQDVVIESLRATWEVDALKENGGVLIAVDADQKLRYERITNRGSSSDHVSFDEFTNQEAIEMNDPDPNGMQKGKVMQMADCTILNNGTLEELHGQIEDFLKK